MKKRRASSDKEIEISSSSDKEYKGLLSGVSELLKHARQAATRSVNFILTATYWEIGRRIMEFEQKGARRAEYGAQVIKQLAGDLTRRFGKGFGYTNLTLMRHFYNTYQNRRPILQTPTEESLSRESKVETRNFSLSWSHYVRLLSLDESYQRDFYEEEAGIAGWSVRQLDRQINSALYERLALSKKKGPLLEEAIKSGKPQTAEEAIKDPYVLEFLGLPEIVSEKDLESALIKHLADFLLELGYGFTFVARQKRLQVGTESYYIDLLLYHRGLKCLVAIDLKIGKFTHADAGQMNLYLNFLQENEKMEGENEPIGLILCTKKDETVAHYALGGIANKVFASRYQLQLPDPEMLRKEIESERRLLESKIPKP